MNKLILKNVSIGYDSISLIKDIYLEIGVGKIIGLIGENGTGKTTFIKSLLKLIPILKGEIILNDKTITQYTPKEWAKIFAVVLSKNQQIPHIKVKELIQIGANPTETFDVDDVVELLEIKTLLNQFATEISDGQLQKVMIARALLQNTPFIIFDEPTAHLDYKNKRKIFELLKNIANNTNKTLIIITHEVLHTLTFCDDIWLIKNKTLHIGKPKEIDSKFNLIQDILQNTPYGN